jgi:hypothetical protein
MTYNTSNTPQDVKSAFLKHCEQLDITNNKDGRLLLCARIEFGRSRTGKGLRGEGRGGWCEEWARSG